MDVQQIFRTAVRNLLANKVRFTQSMLAMVIGVAAVIVVLSMGNNLLKSISSNSAQYSPGMIQMRVMTNTKLSQRITAADMEQLAIDRPDIIKSVTPYILFTLKGGVRYDNVTNDNVIVMGVGEHYIDVSGLQLAKGRFLQQIDIDREQKVCVVGADLASELLGDEAIGKTLKVWGENYTVIGVTEENKFETDENTTVFIPYTNAVKILPQKTTPNYDYNCTFYIDFYFVDANGTENMYAAITAVEEMIQERMGREKGETWQLGVMTAAFLENMLSGSIYNTMLAILLMAGIILIVSGVGIMNVMLFSVKARTQEIGIRKAFGATNQDIKRQFTLEAVMTCFIGGFIGIVIGLIGSYSAYKFIENIPMGSGVVIQPTVELIDFPLLPILLSLAICAGLGVIFGTYPAQQAAKMEIVEAINSD